MSISPVVVLFVASFWFFSSRYKIYRPSIKSVDFSKAGDLFNLGVKFFIIQIQAVFLYQANNIIIAQLFGPEQVTPYNVAFKYFSVLLMVFTIVITPFWSAFTDAWATQEIQWVKNIMRRLMILWIGLFVAGVIMLICSPWIYTIWVGDKVKVTYTMSTLVATWILIRAWNSIFSHFLNGVGKVSLQLVIGFFVALINIPLSIFLGKLIGIEGIFLTNIFMSVVTVFILPIQYKKLINGTATGIFNI
jgi:O-antigen/teichoic acid export membrane protein